jgi:hypothetical protein
VTQSIRHVTSNERLDRVVVVAHSLGSTIAVDAILRLARDARANPRPDMHLRKITHLVTYGSPVDKIHYFFEESGPVGHRYNRIVEDLRGDIGTEPFGNNNGVRFVHWVNFWDEADLISGPLQSPNNGRFPDLVVDNVQIPGAPVPMPGPAHTGYLLQPEVIDGLIEVLFRRTTGRRDGPHAPDRPFGPGRGRAWVRPLQQAVAVGVWVLAAGFVLALARDQLWLIAWGFAIILAVSALGLLFARVSSMRVEHQTGRTSTG